MKSKVLARIEESSGKKQIFMCQSGCVHLTYDTVTLNFPGIETVLALAQTFRTSILPELWDDDTQMVELCYGRVCLQLKSEEAEEIARLLRDAEFVVLDDPTYRVTDMFPWVLPRPGESASLIPLTSRRNDSSSRDEAEDAPE